MEQITLHNVTKKYNGTIILNEISHTFNAGETIAFMGHNGCGKSTLLKIMAGLITPTAGKVSYPNPVLFHYVPEKFAPLSLTARQYLKRMGEMDGIPAAELGSVIEEMCRDFYLQGLLDRSMKHLSKGTLQKIGVIQALLKAPDVLLLDEPLSGQDEASQMVFIRKMDDLKKQGVSIFMACHEQSLVDALAEQTYTIQSGRLMPFHPEKHKMYTLLLDNSGNRQVPEGMQWSGSGYRLSVTEGAAREIILRLLGDGWELRGMYDEKSD